MLDTGCRLFRNAPMMKSKNAGITSPCSIYTAYSRVKDDIRKIPALPVPLHIRNAHTSLMKDLGYGKGYKYPHDFPDSHVEEEYLPENLKRRIYYHPTDRGVESEIGKRLKKWRQRKRGE